MNATKEADRQTGIVTGFTKDGVTVTGSYFDSDPFAGDRPMTNKVPLELFTPEALEHPEVRKIFRLQNPGKPLPKKGK